MPRTTNLARERAELIAALGLEPEGRGKNDKYDMTIAELRAKLKNKPKSRLSPVARETRASERTEVTEDDVKAAVSVIQREYYQDVHYVGDELKEQIERGEISDEETFSDRLAEAVDNTQRVIYTWQSKLGLLVSENADAYVDEIGEYPIEDGTPNYMALMSMAMQADVRRYIGDVEFRY